jgi:hypothetical protein
MDIGGLMRIEEGKIIVWNRKTKTFDELEQIPKRDDDLTTTDHLIDLYNITKKYGFRKAIDYEIRSTRASIFSRVYVDGTPAINLKSTFPFFHRISVNDFKKKR